ncbi:MAG: ATP-binding protein [Chloroflexota bacterium]
MPRIRVALLGVPIVERGGMAIEVDTRKAIALLAYLAMSEGPQSRDTIASLLWCDLDASGARAALRRTLSTLKSALHEPALESDRRTIMLRRDSLDIDVDRFRSALERVRGHTHALRQACPACLPLLVEAVTLSRGDFLTGFSLRDALEFDDWQLLQTEALRQDLAEALEGIVAALSKTGRHQDAIQYAQRWLKLDPLHEAAHRSLMQLYSRSGQRSSALRQYRECVRILEEELAVPPVEETTRLYQAIKEREDSSSSSEPIMPVAEQSAPRLLPLVGRAREWDALAGAFEAMRRGGHVVALEGEAGVGKTRLLDELLRYSRTAGAATVRARCFEGETELAYAPVIHLLRTAIGDVHRSDALKHSSPRDLTEVARLLPEIDAIRPRDATFASGEFPGAQTRFLDGVGRVLLATGRGSSGSSQLVLALDDLQWADAASLECLAYILRRLDGNHVGVVLTWRSEGLPPVHVVRRVIADAQRAGNATVLQLERLDRESVLRLVETLVPASQTSQRDLGEWLYKETEGLPLFLDEYLAAMAGDSLDPAGTPPGMRELLLSRLGSVSETGWQFLTAAAAIGRSFDFDTLQATSGRNEEMAVNALEELSGQGLVREVESGVADVGLRSPGEGPTYDFSPDKLRALVYDRTGLARRRLLHRRVAAALTSRSRNRHDDSLAGQIARHYHLAGMPGEAATCFQRAGDHARTLFANREALAHYQAALALGYPSVAELQEAVGDVYALLGEYRAAASRYELAAALTEGQDQARIEHKLGTVHHRWGGVGARRKLLRGSAWDSGGVSGGGEIGGAGESLFGLEHGGLPSRRRGAGWLAGAQGTGTGGGGR